MDAPTLLAVGFLVLAVVLVFIPRRRLTPPPKSEEAPLPQFTFLRVGGDLHRLEGGIGLSASSPPRLTHPVGYLADGERATLSFAGEEHVLVGPLEPATLEMEGIPRSVVLRGVQGQFISPPNARVVRERTIFVGTDDEALGNEILDAFALPHVAESGPAIPWTLDGAARYATRYLLDQGIAKSAETLGDGEVEIEFDDEERGRINLTNMFLNQMEGAHPTEALEALRRFLDGVAPKETALQRDQLLPRVHHGVPPIYLTGTLPSGATVQHELSSQKIGDDLCVLLVQDLPDRMRYLGPSDVEAIEPEPGLQLELAMKNLSRSLQRIRILGDGPVYMVVCGGNYEASLILLPELWDTLDPLLDGDRLIAIPARDLLFVTGDADEVRRQQMAILAEPGAELAYPVSDGVYRWRPEGGWERLP